MATNRQIKTISFDLDNTLWDIDSVMHRATEVQDQWLCVHRPKVVELLPPDEMFAFKKQFLRNNPHLRHQISELRIQALKALQLAAGYSEHEAETGARNAFEVVLEARHDVTYYEHAREVLEALTKTHTLVALSNGNADVYRLAVGQFFHSAIRAEQHDTSKPDPALFHAALTSAGALAHQSVHVGDNPVDDIHGANAVGMHSVWFNPEGIHWPGGPPPSEEITSLAELPRAIANIEAKVGGTA